MKEALIASGLDVYDNDINNELINNANANERIVSNDLGEKYGGMWIDYDDSNNAYQVIAITEPLNISKKSYLNDNVRFTLTKYSYPLLKRVQENAAALLLDEMDTEGKKLIKSIDIDIPQNIIFINASENSFTDIKEYLRKNNFDLSMFDLRKQEEFEVETGDLYGGTRITFGVPGTFAGTRGGPLCTAGFNAFADGIYPVILTAGHCNKDASQSHVFFNDAPSGQYSNSGDYIGQFLANKYFEGIDAVLFGNTANHNTHSRVLLSPSTSIEYKDVIPVTAGLVNSRVCAYGGTSGWRCGMLSSIDNIRTKAGVAYNFRLSIANFCSLKGDSGGPVLSSSNNAIGLISATENSNGLTCATVGGTFVGTSFQPISSYFSRVTNVRLLLNKP